MLWFPPPGLLFFIIPDTLLYLRRFVAPVWCIIDGGWLRAVPCGKMEESWGGRVAVADCFLLSPGTLGIIVMKRSVCRGTVLCRVSCPDLHELHALYHHLNGAKGGAPRLPFSNRPSVPLPRPSSWVYESLLENLNRGVNNVEISSKKPNLVLPGALCKSFKKLITVNYLQ